MSTLQTREQTPQIVRHLGPVARRAGTGARAGGISGRDVWRIIRKRKWLIILPTVFFTAVAFVGTMLWRRYAPTYTADAYLQVRPGYADVFERQLDPRADVVKREVLYQAHTVTSQDVLEAALGTPQVRKLRWYAENRDNAVEALREVLDVSPKLDTDLIRVSVDGRNREEVAELANAVAAAHVKYITQRAGERERGRIAQLGKQLRTNQEHLKKNRGEQNRLRGRPASPSDLAARGATLRASLEAFGRQLTHAGLAVAQARGINEIMKKQAESGELVNSPEVAAAVEADPRLRGLRQREGDLSVVIEAKKIQLGPQHRTVQNLELQLKTVMAQIEEREKKVQDYQIKALVERSKINLESLIAQQIELQQRHEEIKNRVQDTESILIRLQELRTDEDQIEDQIERIERRITELTLAMETRVPVLGRPAELPAADDPSSPKWTVNIPIGVAVGLLIGLGLAFLLELVDTSVSSPADLVRRTGLAVLGTVPHTRDLEEEVDDIRRAFADNRGSLVGEAFRQIRTCVQFSGPVEHRRSILITSSLPDDGRTTVTMNLAASVARSGRRVLVVDTNFRQPVVSRLFVGDGSAVGGLSNVLVGQAQQKDVVHEVEPNLYVMASGPMPPNPAELLGSDPMRQLLAEALEEFDQVLLDGAPCLVVTDPIIVSTVVDGVVLVVRAGTNTYGMIQRAGESLTRIGARVLGTVINGVRVTVGGYLRENYDRFYEYQEQIELPAK